MTYDVVVVGLGTAGAVAAIAAGRAGASVLALEESTYPGGMQTGGFISGYFKQEPSGLAAELENESRELARTGGYAAPVEAKKRVLEQRALAAGCQPRYDVVVREAIREGGRLVALRYSEAGRESVVRAHTFIDATAEAALARLAGCELRRGRDLDGKNQHFAVHQYCRKERNGIPAYADIGIWGRVDPRRIREFSAAYLRGLAWLERENHGGQRLSASCDRPGIREGWHIVGERGLGMGDFLLRAPERGEVVAIARAPFDTNVTDIALESEDFQDLWLFEDMRKESFHFALPKSVLFPRDLSGLIVAGRCIAVNHDLECALRMNALMGQLGEAAGTIAALAARGDGRRGGPVAPEAVAADAWQPRLALDWSLDWNNEVRFGLSDDEIRAGLNSDRPGRAVWSAYRKGKTALLRSEFGAATSERQRWRAALGLALLREPEVLPYLRLVSRDGAGAAGEAAVRGYQAVYLLGRFRDADAVEALGAGLERVAPDGPPESHASGDGFLRHEWHSRAFMALSRIGEDHPETREAVAAILRRRMDSPDGILHRPAVAWNPRSLVRADEDLHSLARAKIDGWK